MVGALAWATAAVPVASASGSTATAEATFAGGCYWGVESVFLHVRGVKSAVSGFAVTVEGKISSEDPGYVEAVRVRYDPSKVTYQQLLEIFFLVVHDPTQVGHQGPDHGLQYRSVVFVNDSAERQVVQSFIDRLSADRRYPAPIVTQLAGLKRFREADPDQQNYAARHEDQPYIIINDAPKLLELKKRFPTLAHD